LHPATLKPPLPPLPPTDCATSPADRSPVVVRLPLIVVATMPPAPAPPPLPPIPTATEPAAAPAPLTDPAMAKPPLPPPPPIACETTPVESSPAVEMLPV
jgi:hypothetical protein